MAKKNGSKSGGKFMDNAVGVHSYKTNPMKQPSRVSPECGPGSNADQQKANRLLKQAIKEKDSLRGKLGM